MTRGINLWDIAEQAGVYLKDAADYTPSQRRPRECYCKPTLKRIGDRRGADHLRLVLRLMVGIEANRMALYADAIRAMSDLLWNHPTLVQRASLVSEIDKIDILALRTTARVLRSPYGTAGTIYTLLAVQLGLPDQGDLFARAA